MNTVMIANFVSMIGCGLMVAVGLLQKRRQILLVQCVQFAFLGIANLLLGGMTGFISGAVSIVRNLLYVRRDDAARLKLVFIGVQVVLSLSVGIDGLVDWFPILSTVLFTWFLETKSEVRLKLVMILAQSMWLIYDFSYMNYVAFTFDALTIVSNGLGILALLRKTKDA